MYVQAEFIADHYKNALRGGTRRASQLVMFVRCVGVTSNHLGGGAAHAVASLLLCSIQRLIRGLVLVFVTLHVRLPFGDACADGHAFGEAAVVFGLCCFLVVLLFGLFFGFFFVCVW